MTLRSLSLLVLSVLLLSGCYVAAGTPGPVYGYGHRSYGYGYYERPHYRHYGPPVVHVPPSYGYRGRHHGRPHHPHHRRGWW